MLEKVRDILGLTKIPIDQIRTKRNKIEWDHFFLCEAYLASLRSHDPQTQCGCVLTQYNNIISTGYNGFIAGIDDDVLPNLRPYKYPFMMHAEQNAIFNCAKNGISTLNATAYITVEPCNSCLQYMWQSGIVRIVYTDINNIVMLQNDEHLRVREAILCVLDDMMEINFIPSENFIEIVDKIRLKGQ